MTFSDEQVRKEVLDPQRSFIVQAPAGSGKTELLTQRILCLLAEAVAEPGQILAITFTQKAALEMAERVMVALRNAQEFTEPMEEPKRSNWRLARQVLIKDQALGWGLLIGKTKLNIQTIDAFCADLVRQSPASLTQLNQIAQYPDVYYAQAAFQTLQRLITEIEYRQSITELLKHLDYQLDLLIQMLSRLLMSRDQWMPQWLPYWGQPDALKALLERSLKGWITAGLSQALTGMMALKDLVFDLAELTELLRFSQAQLQASGALASDIELPLWSADAKRLPQWQSLANLLITSSGEWRKPKGVNKKIGFPASTAGSTSAEKQIFKEKKGQLQAVLQQLADEAWSEETQTLLEAWRLALVGVRELPDPYYAESEWRLLYQLICLLPHTVAELDIVFQEAGCADYISVALSALSVLREAEASGLALQLDQKIWHILIDEFQDTSITQFELFKCLTQYWGENEPTRTLFLVGDPMQSIYRFRQADVGLFLLAKHRGVGHIPLEYRRLTRNFRADAFLVHWANEAFQPMFPSNDIWWQGAITFSAAQATQALDQPGEVQWSLSVSKEQHLKDVITAVVADDQRYPERTKAILVRNRRHAQTLLTALKAQNIPVEAVEIERLIDLPMAQDLLSLAEALLYPHYDLAWVAVLRAPWIGIPLADIQRICQSPSGVFETLRMAYEQDFSDTVLSLSEDATLRIKQCWPVFLKALLTNRNQMIEDRVHRVWVSLRAESCYPTHQRFDSHLFFELLTTLRVAQQLHEPTVLNTRVAELFASQLTASNDDSRQPIQIMTIHKSKGLEFDHVYLPFLDKRPRAEESPLLRWAQFYFPHAPHAEAHQIAEDSQEEGWLLALFPDQVSGQVYQTIQQLEKQKSQYEAMRLFYVAATRAKKSLHLMGCFQPVELSSDLTYRAPMQQSFLGLLHGSLTPSQQESLIGRIVDSGTHLETEFPQSSVEKSPAQLTLQPLYRVAQVASMEKVASSNTTVNASVAIRETVLVLDDRQRQPREYAATLGTLWHHLVANAPTVRSLKAVCHHPARDTLLRSWLLPYGFLETEVVEGVRYLQQAMSTMLDDPVGQWLLQERATNQVEVSFSCQNKVYRLDKTFVDDEGTGVDDEGAEQAVRWIVDYKLLLNKHSDSQIKVKYQAQLEQYAEIFLSQKLPIWLGLYMPLQQQWVCWQSALSEAASAK